MATRGSYVHNSMVKFGGGASHVSFMQFSQNIGGFRQNYSQGFQNSYNSKLSVKRNLLLLQSDIHWNPLHQNYSYLDTD